MRVSVKSQLVPCCRWGLAFALCAGLACQVVAQDVPTADIQIGDAEGEGAKEKVENPWIGVAAGAVTNEMRGLVELPGNSGLIIRQVVPDSPAEKADLREYDILIRADKNPLGKPADLVEIVETWDQQTDGIKLEWIRRGKEMSEIITPEERPDNIAGPGELGIQGVPRQLGAGELPGFDRQLEAIQKQMGQNGMRFRILGPGVQAGAHSVQSVDENGLKVRIERSNDDPAKIAVDDGESKWNITEDQLDQLPDEIAARVNKMLKNSNVKIDVNRIGLGQMPNIQVPQMPQFRQMQRQMEGIGIPRMQERFDDMEKQMQKMLEEIERLQAPLAPPAEDDGINPDNDA